MKIVDGNKACSRIAYLFSEVCSIYPITPSSPMAESIDFLSHTSLNNLFNSKPKVIEMQSEAGAAGALHGALLSGSLASTFTASQGLLLMIPNMYKIAGEKLPGVMHVASRTIATHALSIFGDHSDIYAARATGWCMLSSTNVEDAQALAAVAHLSALEASLPFVHFFDGFRTSHELNTVPEIKDEDLLSLINKDALEKFKKRSLNINNNVTYGSSQTEDIFFQIMESKNKDYENAADVVNKYMQKINALTSKNYAPFNYYGDANADSIIIAMGSVCDTIKRVIDFENKNGKKYGLIEVHLYRPFSKKYLENVIPKTTSKIAVLDMAKEQGSAGEPLYLDVLSALKNKNLIITHGRYGLSSKNTTPSQIKAVYNMLDGDIKDGFTIGIDDDVTGLSLKEDTYTVPYTGTEILIYGFGSDGMVSASKELLTILNQKLGKYVQGYFEYDSKKSGGVTISHLRYNDESINMPYYVDSPSLVVITKEEYFQKYDMLNNIKENGTLIINTVRGEDELNHYLPNDVKRIIKDKNISVYTINAGSIAYHNNIKGKINKIMEVIILNKLGVEDAKDIVINDIKEVFKTKGSEIIDNNINAIISSLDALNKINIDDTNTYDKENDTDIFRLIDKRKGNTIPVSKLMDISDGHLPGGLSKNEKRNISNLTPKWNKEKCIECGMCAFVCPHAVIRNFVTKDKTIGKPLIGNNDYNFVVGISNEDCTGCMLCSSICPAASITMEKDVKPTNELFNTKNDELFNKFTIKGSSLLKPHFEYSGACAGCGETPYLRLLSSLFGESIVIANATGCSSIYGASCPSTPYTLPWANSLFEDNAEFALGLHLSYENKKEQIINAMKSSIEAVDNETKELFNKYLENINDDKITKDIANSLDKAKVPKEINDLIDYLPKRTVWAVGGDGWAYDIGYGGIDHILHSGENVKILVLDTEVYSNTGGQASKSTKLGAVAEFADLGKKTNKKDLFKIASGIDNVYAAEICLGANMMQTITAFKEAMEHNGPAIIIAYCPCVEHGIKGGMVNSISEEKLAVECGYKLLMRCINNKLIVDSKDPNFDKYENFLLNEVRYNALKIKDENLANILLSNQKENAIKRYNYYLNKKD